MVPSDPILLPNDSIELDRLLPIIRLPHPRTRSAALFAIRPTQKIWEIKSIGSPSTNPSRSWFYESSNDHHPDLVLSRQAGRLLFLTPFDPFFLLLGLFYGHPSSGGKNDRFEVDGNKSGKDGDHQTRFEEIDSILERAQDQWFFANTQDTPSSGDLELWTTEALRDQHLQRVCCPLRQEDPSTKTLWRLDPQRIVREIKRKIDHLANVGLSAGFEAHSVWTRLAREEGLLSSHPEPSDSSLINETYRKIALGMIQSYLPDSISDYLDGLDEFKFEGLKQRLSDLTPVVHPPTLEIGRNKIDLPPGKPSNKTSLTSDSKKKRPKIAPDDDTLSSSSSQKKVTLHKFFAKLPSKGHQGSVDP